MKKTLGVVKLILIIIVLLIILFTIVQNLNLATVNFLFWNFSLPVIVILLIMLLVGFILGLLLYPAIFGGIEKKDKEALEYQKKLQKNRKHGKDLEIKPFQIEDKKA